MAASLSTISGKDGGGATIVGGIQALDLSGAGTGPWSFANVLVDGLAGTLRAAVTASNALKVDGSAVTQPVSWSGQTVAATQSGTWTVQPGNTPNTSPWLTTISQGGTSATVGTYGTSPGAVGALNANVFVTNTNTNGQQTMANSSPVVIASNQSAIPVSQSGTWTPAGAGSIASAVPSTGVYASGNASTALATAATAGNLTGVMLDKFGRQVSLPVTIRDLMGTQTTTLSATTTETTIVTAIGSTFNDLVCLIVSNTSASTNTRIDFRDTTAGTIIFSLESIAGAPPVGIPFMGAPIPQSSVNTNWTAQCATSTTDIRILAVYAKNK